jgi:ABC-2 type transport system permease protein
VRTALFLLIAALSFGVHYHAAGFAPAAAVVLVFIPFIWGVGATAAAGVLTFRRGASLFGAGAFALTFSSGAFFPLGVLPHWLETIAKLNPIAVAIDACRRALLGGDGWSDLLPRIGVIAGASAVAMVLGLVSFRLALQRERRLGTLGMY